MTGWRLTAVVGLKLNRFGKILSTFTPPPTKKILVEYTAGRGVSVRVWCGELQLRCGVRGVRWGRGGAGSGRGTAARPHLRAGGRQDGAEDL